MKLSKSGTKKGFADIVWTIVMAVIAFVVLGLVVTYGSDITEDQHEDVCPSGDTFITNTSRPAGALTTSNPVTSAWYGCCQTVTSPTNNCTVWRTNNYAVNASAESLDAQVTMAEKQDTMANVIMAGAIITILMVAFGFSMRGRR